MPNLNQSQNSIGMWSLIISAMSVENNFKEKVDERLQLSYEKTSTQTTEKKSPWKMQRLHKRGAGGAWLKIPTLSKNDCSATWKANMNQKTFTWDQLRNFQRYQKYIAIFQAFFLTVSDSLKPTVWLAIMKSDSLLCNKICKHIVKTSKLHIDKAIV